MKMHKLFRVEGMMCAACQAHVAKAVSALPGAENVSVQLITKDLNFDCDDEQLTDDALIAALRKKGFRATLISSTSLEAEAEAEGDSGDLFAEFDDMAQREEQDRARRQKRKIALILSFLCLIPLTLLHFNVFGVPQAPMARAWISLVLLLPILYFFREVFILGFKRLFQRVPDMFTLIALGAATGIVYSLCSMGMSLAGANPGCHVYFEAAGMILVFVNLGKYLEERNKDSAAGALRSLMSRMPRRVTVWRNGQETEIGTNELKKGDTVVLRSGVFAAADGEVAEGFGSMNTAAITGESTLVEVKPGAKILSGSVCADGYLQYRVTRAGRNSLFAKMISQLHEAVTGRAPVTRITDKVSAVFVPTVIGIALLSAAIWLIATGSVTAAVNALVAVLVISCPCALGLAAPVAVMAGIGRGAELGILFKNAETLEHFCATDTLVLDKTGTLTSGKATISAIVPVDGVSEKGFIALAAGLEKASAHPYAAAIQDYAARQGIASEAFDAVSQIPGGVRGVRGNDAYTAGSRSSAQGADGADGTDGTDDISAWHFYKNGELIGTIRFADVPRPEAKEFVRKVQAKGIRCIMLTGDRKEIAERIAADLGIGQVISGVLPSGKHEVIQALKKEGRAVAMMGDGINDATALVAADTGIALSDGTDVSILSAGIVLLNNDLQSFLTALNLSHAVIRNIKMNLFWAFFYNLLCIPLAAGALYPLLHWQLPPAAGAIAMTCSSVTVVLNALRLRKA